MVTAGGLRKSETKSVSFKNKKKGRAHDELFRVLLEKNKDDSEQLSSFNLFLILFIIATLWIVTLYYYCYSDGNHPFICEIFLCNEPLLFKTFFFYLPLWFS